MRYIISGKHIDVGESLKEHVKQELNAVVDKYAQRATGSNVVFSRKGHEFIAEIEMHLSSGLSAQAKSSATDVYAAFDIAANKLGKQLRRYKRRLKDYGKNRSEPVELSAGSSYILASSHEEDDGDAVTLEPMIIAEMETQIPALSVGEAVMQMELKGAPVLLFRNSKEGRINVVYHREDGNIGWVDPNA